MYRYLANGEEAEDYKVTWDLSNADFSTGNTIVTVNGKVELLGKEYPVTAKIRVTAALKAARNLAINKASENHDIPKLSQSPTNTSDRLGSINNGVNGDGNNTNERWTNWNERDLTVNGQPKGAYVQFDWENKYDIDRLDLWLFTDSAYSRIPKKVEISYKNDKGEYGIVTHSNTTEVSYISGETTYLLNKVINTDSIRIYMQQPEVGKCIGLTEVNIYQHNPKVTANTINTLSEIKLDGDLLEGFDSNKNEYTVNLNLLPDRIEATATDNAAVTILPIYNNKSLITVMAEDGSKSIYTVNYVLPQAKEYNVTVNSTEGGSVVGDGKYVEGKEAILVAIENNGYKFLGWFDKDDNKVSSDKTYRFVVSADALLTAKFEKVTTPGEPGNPEVDKTLLGLVINYAEEVKANGALENIVPAVVSEFEAALENAKVILANQNSTEVQMDEASKRLISVIHMLDFKKGYKVQLKKLVGMINASEESKYTTSTWSVLESELEKANKVVADENAMEVEVKEAYNKLIEAFLDLRLIPNKSMLEELLNKAEDIDTSKYTRASVNRFNENLDNAKAVLSNEDATEEDVKEAAQGLELALASLELAQAGTENNDVSDSKDNNNKGNTNSTNNNSEKGNSNSKLPSTGSPVAPFVIMLGSLGVIVLGAIMLRGKSRLKR